jgi:hypothetical protein
MHIVHAITRKDKTKKPKTKNKMSISAKTQKTLDAAKAAYQAKTNGQSAIVPVKAEKRAKSKSSAKNKASKNKAKAKSKDKAPVAQVQPESEKVTMGKFIATGSRGTAFLLTIPTALEIGERYAPMEKLHLPESFGSDSAARSKHVGNLHAQGKASGVVWIDSISWIAPRGEKYTVYTLATALNKGIVKKLKATISRDGSKAKQVSLYVGAKFNAKSDKYPHCFACSDVKAGRVETRLVNDGRNASLVYKVKLAK